MKGGTKFWLGVLSVVGLLGSAFAGKFTGELGLYVSGIAVAYFGGNSYITGKALANGKAGEP